MRRIIPLIFVTICAGCLAEGVCNKRKACAADPPGADFVAVCVETYNGRLRALDVNQEEVCRQLKEATVALDSCAIELDCSDLAKADLGGNCTSERDDLTDAILNAEDECTTLD